MTVQWRKSTYSSGVEDEHCVELGRLTAEAGIGIRDSKDPGGGHLALTAAAFAELVEQLKRRSVG
jgi:hypothetical protein